MSGLLKKNSSDAVVNPLKGGSFSDPGTVAIMVSSGKEMESLCTLLGAGQDDYKDLMISRICTIDQNGIRCSVVGPIIGAPYAVLLLETLGAGGAAANGLPR